MTSRRLVINVSRAANGNRQGGISRTVEELSRNITLANGGEGVEFINITATNRVVYASTWYERFGLSKLRGIEQFKFEPGDILLELDLSLPPRYLSGRTIQKLKKKGVFVFYFVYDVLPLTHPNFFKLGKRVLFSIWMKSVRKADGILTISNTTLKELLSTRAFNNWIGKPPIKHISLGSNLQSQRAPQKKISESTSVPNLLMVGTIEPRKGYDEVLRVVSGLWRDGLVFNFAIVGRRGWKCKRTAKVIEHMVRTCQGMSWLDAATDEDLSLAYAKADLLISNSHAEGLGLPLLEASSLGLNVLCRDIEVFREIGKTNFEYFRDGEDLRRLLEDWLSHTNSAKKSPMNSAHVSGVTWQQTAAETLDFVRSVVADR